LAKSHHVITTDPSSAYGESDASGIARRGVPFMQHTRVGGGMCGQAVCFATTLLLHEHVDAVHGVSEISVLADGRDIRDARLVLAERLTDFQICSYLNARGLSCRLSVSRKLKSDDQSQIGSE